MTRPMPHHFEKGPYMLITEDYFNGASPERLARALAVLRSPDESLGESIFFTSPAFDPDPIDNAGRTAHIAGHMFGRVINGEGHWDIQQPFDPVENPRTGLFTSWYGDAEGVFRQTLVRAIEVSLGLEHGEELVGEPRRHWPIEIVMKCPQAFLEGWVSWRRHGDGERDGQVNVFLALPGQGSGILDCPVRPEGMRRRGFAEEPSMADEDQGMWVISHRDQTVHTIDSTVPSALGDWGVLTPGPVVHSHGPIVCVSPSEVDGGVRPGGRAYVEPELSSSLGE